jgi:hypothetical protein
VIVLRGAVGQRLLGSILLGKTVSAEICKYNVI